MPELLLQLLKTPGLTGAVTPSSRHLAVAMVRATGEVRAFTGTGADYKVVALTQRHDGERGPVTQRPQQ